MTFLRQARQFGSSCSSSRADEPSDSRTAFEMPGMQRPIPEQRHLLALWDGFASADAHRRQGLGGAAALPGGAMRRRSGRGISLGGNSAATPEDQSREFIPPCVKMMSLGKRHARSTGERLQEALALILHRRGLLNWYHYPISTAPLEGTNTKIRLMQRPAGRPAFFWLGGVERPACLCCSAGARRSARGSGRRSRRESAESDSAPASDRALP